MFSIRTHTEAVIQGIRDRRFTTPYSRIQRKRQAVYTYKAPKHGQA